MHNWSLICFTLLTQSAIGLLWLSALGRWLGSSAGAASVLRPALIAAALTGFGLIAATAHLSKPRLAPHAVRNLKTSWLSREVVLVQIFVGFVVLLIVLAGLGFQSLLWICEFAVCISGGAALWAMTQVYRLGTVPVWNSVATPLEFAGSALLLGGGLSACIGDLTVGAPSGTSPSFWIANTGIGFGLALKVLAISPTLAAGATASILTWYAPTGPQLSLPYVLAIRAALSAAGFGLILATLQQNGTAVYALVCFTTGEIVGRWRFYAAYTRVGL